MTCATGSISQSKVWAICSIVNTINLTIGANLPNPKSPIKQELNYPVD
jgi:hypothetical protein